MGVVVAEFVFFRQLAGLASDALGQGWEAGSSILYFRDTHFLPAVVSLFLASGFAWMTAVKRDASGDRRILVIAWIVDVAVVIGSLGWYFAVVLAAGRFGGH